MSEENFKLSTLSKGEEYTNWKKKLILLLTAKDIDCVLEDNAESKKDFNRKDAKARYIIISSLCDKFVVYALNCNTTKEILQKFDTLFLGHEDTQICQLLEQFYKFKFSNSDLMIDIAEIENQAIKLRNLGYSIDEKQIMIKILTSLPEKFAFFRTAWESTQTSEKTLINLISRINLELTMRKENQNLNLEKPEMTPSTSAIETNDNAFVVKSCFECGKKGHIAKYCRQNMNANRGWKNNNLQCFRCLKFGHKHTECSQQTNCMYCKHNSHYTKFCLQQHQHK
ncbi:uncharacterized protein LOC114352387 [Ostrinia furnacalis]|uniref:uncharacterized protein LOC114352387 n=1 Tax=Ostrinia furnacalis TaxID=93504 RepID=UPI0010399717|nr:uncharacterized protein LOC114352387 [Ostrinia furnacalis]